MTAMRRHKKLYSGLFRKTHRRRPNKRLQYLRKRRKTRAKKVKRALRKESLRPSEDTPEDSLDSEDLNSGDTSRSSLISEAIGKMKAISAKVVFEEFPRAEREMYGGKAVHISPTDLDWASP